MFEDCSSLTVLDLRSFDTSKVTDMTTMFKGCSKLETLILGDKFVTTGVKKMDEIFSGCTSLTKVYASPDTFDRSVFDGTPFQGKTPEPYVVKSSGGGCDAGLGGAVLLALAGLIASRKH